MKKNARLMAVAMVVILTAASAAFSQMPGMEKENSGLIPGTSVGSLKVEKDGGGQIDLGKYGRPYVIGFFVPGRDDIASQFGDAAKLLKKKEFAGIDLIAVTYVNGAAEKKTAREYLKSKKITAVLAFDAKLDVVRRFGVGAIPVFYMVDGNGLVRSQKITDVNKIIRKSSFGDFLKYLKKGERIPMVDFIPWEDTPKSMRAMIGKPAPDFTLADLDGRKYTLSKLKGKNVIVVFFSPTCSHCLRELPMVQDFYLNNKDRYNLEVFAIAMGGGKEQKKKVRKVIFEKVLSFPVVIDPKGGVFADYGIKPVPAAYFVDKNGVIQELLLGETDFFAMVYHSIFLDPLRLGR
jgi:peroxiredoxin